MSINLKMLKALNGDCILVSYGKKNKKNILIDGGIGAECFNQLKKLIEKLKSENKKLDLIVLTHIDDDHISGIIRMFSAKNFDFSIINQMWFNYGKNLNRMLKVSKNKNIREIYLYEEKNQISIRQAKDLETVLQEKNVNYIPVKKNEIYEIADAKITLLSPRIEILKALNKKSEKEIHKKVKIAVMNDYSFSVKELNNKKFKEKISLENKSSIAFVFEWNKKKVLFLGDAAASEIEISLSERGYSMENPLDITCCKISHHASKHNTSSTLIQMLKCKNYLISTNKTASGRPSKECLSRIICNTEDPVNFYCNYNINIKDIFTNEEIEKYKMSFIILDEKGINLEELE